MHECHLVLEVGGPSGPVTDKFRWPRSNSMNHIINYYFANEIEKKNYFLFKYFILLIFSNFINCFYCIFFPKKRFIMYLINCFEVSWPVWAIRIQK